MPFGEDKAVTFGPVGPCGIDPHDVKIQRGDDLHCGKRASGMAGSGVVDHRDDILADLNCLCFQAFHILQCEVIVVHGVPSFLKVGPGAGLNRPASFVP